MKAIVIILVFAVCVCVYVTAKKSKSTNMPYTVKIHIKERERCFKEAGIGAARAIQIENRTAKDMKHKDNCYVSCLLRRNEIINKKGVFDMNSVITKNAPGDIPATIKHSAQSCKKSVEAKTESCVVELDMFNCIKSSVEKKHPVVVSVAYVNT